MNPLTLVPALLLAALVVYVVMRVRHQRRSSDLAADLAAERDGAPAFAPARFHVDARAESLIACDAAASLLHVAVYRGARIDSARLPVAHLESVTTLEDGRPIAATSATRTVGRVTLRVALPDERRSFYDVEFLGRRVARDSARHRDARAAADRWRALLAAGGEPLGAAGALDAAAGADDRPDRPWSSLVDAYPRTVRYAHGGLAAVLCAAAIGPFALSRQPMPPDAPAAGEPLAALPEPVAVEPGTPETKARAFERELPLLFERLTLIDDTNRLDAGAVRRTDIAERIETLDELVRAIGHGRSLPLDAAHAARLEALATRTAEVQTTRLPDYRRLFARATRQGADPVGAWAGGPNGRTLELARSDFGSEMTRTAVWASLAAEAQRLRFERVDFRRFRSGELIESRELPALADAALVISADGTVIDGSATESASADDSSR